jgi:succinate dehydrogenase/fumarate reductase flavoprotein subunit
VLSASEVVTYDAPPAGSADPLPGVADVRDLMWRHVGLVRSREGLEEAAARLTQWSGAIRALHASQPVEPASRRIDSVVTAGLRIARAALRREESRGGHYRADFPARDDARWARHVADVTRPDGF